MTKTSSKNSLIELMRFLFALWVLYYHGFVPYKTDIFSNGFLAVEFFFVLTGFFLMHSIDKNVTLPLKEGLGKFLKGRFKSIAVAFLINEVFVLIYSFSSEFSYNFLFGYLWYIRDLFIAITAIFLLRKWIKNDKIFYSLLILLSAIALFGFGQISILAWPGGPFRSIASIPLGIIASIIPKIPVEKSKSHSALAILGLTVTAIGSFLITILPEKTDLQIYLLVILGYPSLLYFASCISCNSKFLNWLGSLSFPIYSFQCVLRVISPLGITDPTCLFIILMIMVLSFSLATFLFNRYQKKKSKI